ncbi:hypothetical protein HRbin01_01923 [archaeon HR01]|nr:hypothetical protein HRbin01_01923 [archaeon HR01]
MKITEILQREHEKIRKALEILNEKVEEAGRTGELDIYFLKRFIRFSKGFIDEYHQAKEERCFFRYLEKRGIPREGGPIGVILYEHELGRSFLKRMHDAVSRYERGEAGIDEVLDRCAEYIELLNQHIYKEDNMLYPLGDSAMGEEDQSEAYACMERFKPRISQLEDASIA